MEWENKKYVSLSWKTAILLGEDDWRLPTLAELEQAYRDNVSNFHGLTFWSSDEKNNNIAYSFNFFTGRADYTTKETKYCIRLCREGENRELFWEIRDLLQVQEKSALSDDYNLGLYNGIELCLAILEKREPKYKDLDSQIRSKFIEKLSTTKQALEDRWHDIQFEDDWEDRPDFTLRLTEESEIE